MMENDRIGPELGGTIPTCDQFIEPLLRYLAQHPEGAVTRDIQEALADQNGAHRGTASQQRIPLPNGASAFTAQATEFARSVEGIVLIGRRSPCEPADRAWRRRQPQSREGAQAGQRLLRGIVQTLPSHVRRAFERDRRHRASLRASRRRSSSAICITTIPTASPPPPEPTPSRAPSRPHSTARTRRTIPPFPDDRSRT